MLVCLDETENLGQLVSIGSGKGADVGPDAPVQDARGMAGLGLVLGFSAFITSIVVVWAVELIDHTGTIPNHHLSGAAYE